MIKDLETAIGYRFRNISLLQNALSHSSYANERWRNSLMSNERLEFLGDSVLGMLVADYLYRNFPDRPEGELTRMRADMVRKSSSGFETRWSAACKVIWPRWRMCWTLESI